MSCDHQQTMPGSGGLTQQSFIWEGSAPKVWSGVMCENAQYFYEKEFLEGMWGPCVYDCSIQLFISPAKTTIFTFLEVIFIHSIYSSSYPKKKQRKDPTKSEKKSLVRKKSWRIAY